MALFQDNRYFTEDELERSYEDFGFPINNIGGGDGYGVGGADDYQPSVPSTPWSTSSPLEPGWSEITGLSGVRRRVDPEGYARTETGDRFAGNLRVADGWIYDDNGVWGYLGGEAGDQVVKGIRPAPTPAPSPAGDAPSPPPAPVPPPPVTPDQYEKLAGQIKRSWEAGGVGDSIVGVSTQERANALAQQLAQRGVRDLEKLSVGSIQRYTGADSREPAGKVVDWSTYRGAPYETYSFLQYDGKPIGYIPNSPSDTSVKADPFDKSGAGVLDLWDAAGQGHVKFAPTASGPGGLIGFTPKWASSSDLPGEVVAALGIALTVSGVGAALGSAITSGLGIGASASVNALIGNTVMQTVLNGGDIESAVKGSLASYVGAQVGEFVGKAAGSFFSNPEGIRLISNVANQATRATILGQDVESAIKNTVVAGAVDFATAKIPGFNDLPNAVKDTVKQSINAALQGKDVDVGTMLANAAKEGILSYGLNQIPEFKSADARTQSFISTMLRTALDQGDLTQSAINWAVGQAQQEFQKTIKAGPALDELKKAGLIPEASYFGLDDKMKTLVDQFVQQKDPKAAASNYINSLSTTDEEIRKFFKELTGRDPTDEDKDLLARFTGPLDEATARTGLDNQIRANESADRLRFDELNKVLSNPNTTDQDLVNVMSEYKITPAFIERVTGRKYDDITKELDARFMTQDEVVDAYKEARKAAGLEPREPTGDEILRYFGKPASVTAQIQADMDREATVFDGSKFGSVQSASEAAKSQGYNNFVGPDGKTYMVSSPVVAIQSGAFDGTKFGTVQSARDAAKAAGKSTFVGPDEQIYSVLSLPQEGAIKDQVKSAKTFGEAFAEARSKLGPGRTFEWTDPATGQTKTYNTYYGTELYDGSRAGSKFDAAILARNNGAKFFQYDGKIWSIPPGSLDNVGNQSLAESKRLVEASVRAVDAEQQRQLQIKAETKKPGDMDGVPGALANLFGITSQGLGQQIQTFANAYAAITGASFDNAAYKVGKSIENIGNSLVSRSLDQQSAAANRLLESGSNASFLDQPGILAKAIKENPGWWGSEVLKERVQELVPWAATLLGTGAAVAGGVAMAPAIAIGVGLGAISDGLESFGAGAREVYDILKKAGVPEDQAREAAIRNGVMHALITTPSEYIADKALFKAYFDNLSNGVKSWAMKGLSATAQQALSEYIETMGQGLATKVSTLDRAMTGGDLKEVAMQSIFAASLGGGTTAQILGEQGLYNAAIVARDKAGQNVTLQELLNGTRDVDLNTLNPNAIIGVNRNGDNVPLGSLTALAIDDGFSPQIFNDVLPASMTTNNPIVLNRDALGNPITVSDVTSGRVDTNQSQSIINDYVDLGLTAKDQRVTSTTGTGVGGTTGTTSGASTTAGAAAGAGTTTGGTTAGTTTDGTTTTGATTGATTTGGVSTVAGNTGTTIGGSAGTSYDVFDFDAPDGNVSEQDQSYIDYTQSQSTQQQGADDSAYQAYLNYLRIQEMANRAGTFAGTQTGGTTAGATSGTTTAGTTTSGGTTTAGTAAGGTTTAGTTAGTTTGTTAGTTAETATGATTGTTTAGTAGGTTVAGLTQDDVLNIVNSVFANNPTLSIDQVKSVVESTIAANPGLKMADVTQAITNALSGLPASVSPTQMQEAINSAVTSITSKQITSADVTKIVNDALAANPGLKVADVQAVVNSAIAGLPAGLSMTDVNTAITNALKTLPTSVTPGEMQTAINAAVADIRGSQLTQADVTTIVNNALAANPGLKVADVQAVVNSAIAGLPAGLSMADVNTAITNALKTLPAGVTPDQMQAAIGSAVSGLETSVAGQIGDLKNSLTAALDDAKAQGLQGDAALQAGIDAVATSLGTTRDDLLSRLGTTEQGLRAEFASQIGGVQTQVTQLGDSLRSAIADARAAGLQGDNALQAGLDKVAADLGTTRGDLLAQMGTTEQALRSEFSSQIGGVQTQVSELGDSLRAAIAEARSAGLDGDAALQVGLDSLASRLGTTRDDLLSTLGATEQSLRTEFASQLGGVQTQVTQLGDSLRDAIAEARAAGLQGDAALQAGIDKVAGDLGTTRESLLSQLGTTEQGLRTELASQIGGVQTQMTELGESLRSAIAEARSAGLQGDAALQVGLDSLANRLGTTRSDLLETLGATEQSLRTEFASQLGGVQTQVQQLSSSLQTAIADARAAGLQGDAALQAGLDSLAGSLGTTRSDLLSQLGQTEQGLRTEFASQLGGVQTQVAQLGDSLRSAIADARAAGLQGDSALQAGLDKVAADLGTTKDSLLSQLGTTEQALRTDFASQLGGVQTQVTQLGDSLQAAIADARAAGLQGDAALQAGIDKVAADLGTTRESLLSQLGTTEQALRTDFASQLGTATGALAGQIGDVETRLLDKINAAQQSGLKGDAALQSAIDGVAADLGTTKDALLGQIGQTEQSLRTQFETALGGVQTQVQQQATSLANLDARIDTLMQQGLDARTATQTALNELGQTQSRTTADLNTRIDTLVQQGVDTRTATQQAINELQTSQQQTTSRIDQRIDELMQQGMTQNAATQQAINELSGQVTTTQTQTQTALQDVNTRINQLMQQGVDYQTATRTAIDELGGGLGELGAGFREYVTSQERQREQDRAAQQQAQQRAQSQQGMQQALTALGVGAAAGPVSDYYAKFKDPFMTRVTDQKFVSPLESFLQEVKSPSSFDALLQGDSTRQPDRIQQEENPMDYFNYGKVQSVEDILKLGEPDQGSSLGFKAGGIVPAYLQGGQIGYAGGGALNVVNFAGKPRIDFRHGSAVHGPGDGQSDDIPAMLADGEYVFDAETVSALGNGSTKAGAEALDKMRIAIRKHKRSGSLDSIPPESKSPLEYLAMGNKRGKK